MKKQRFEGVCIPAMILYMASISIALMYTICRSQTAVCSAAMTAACSAVYILYYLLREKKLLSVLLTGTLTAAAIFMLNLINAFNFSKGGFIDFIFTASQEFNAGYAACAIVIFSIFVGFVCCYFSAIVPRRGMLISPAFVPLILSSRTAGGLPLWIVYLMVGTYLLCSAVVSRRVSEVSELLSTESHGVLGMVSRRTSKIRDDTGITVHTCHRTLMGAGIAVISVIIAFLVPKSTVTPYGNFLDEVFSGQRGGYMNVSDKLSNFVSSSSVNRGANNPQQDLLFVVSSAEKTYIDRWTFDCWNGAKGWSADADYNRGYDNWENRAKLCSSADLIINLKYAAKNGGLERYAERLESIPDYLPDTGTMVIIIADNSTASVVLHPINAFAVRTYVGEKNVLRTPRGELFFSYEPEPNVSYSIQYDSSAVNEYFVREFTYDEICDMIVTASENGFLGADRAEALLTEYGFAAQYAEKQSARDEIPESIVSLAQQITEGAQSDYDKVLALEKWFGEQGFLYDLDYVPMRTDAEYFLFTSKRGICSDYASALTLMVRSLGIPARYTEGFVLADDNRHEDGRYYVTSDKAHAYTQAFIAGSGWVNFDGVKYVRRAEKNAVLTLAVYIAAGAALVLTVLIIIFRKKISDFFFAVGMKLRRPESRVRRAYRRINREACEIVGAAAGTLTTGETAAVLSRALGMHEQGEYIRRVCDELFYNGSVSEDTSKLTEICREVRRQRRRMKK